MRRKINSIDNFSALFAPPLMLLGVLAGFLRFHDYSLQAPESLIALGLSAGAGLLFGVVLVFCGKTHLRGLLAAVLLLIFFDLQFAVIERGHDFLVVAHRLPQWAVFGIYFVVMFAALIVVLSMRATIAPILAASFGVFLLTSLTLPVRTIQFGEDPAIAAGEPGADVPVALHLILDGHIGTEGIPLDLAGGPETKADLESFYAKWGFRLFGRAYSPYFMTYNSVGSVLNADASAEDMAHVDDSRRAGRKYRLLKNEYFDKARQSGQRIRVYQSDYIDFCSDESTPVSYCFTYPVSSVKSVADTALAPTAKATLILRNFYRQSGVVVAIDQVADRARTLLGQLGIESDATSAIKNPQLSSLAVPQIVRRLKRDVLSNPRGNLYFAHLLLPHDPYVWDPSCRIDPDLKQWKDRRRDIDDFSSIGTPDYRSRAYEDYFDQVRCVMALLDDLLASMDAAGLLQDATIIIHGDHGSRITIRDPIVGHIDLLSTDDYIAAFSTLFAIRRPGIEPGHDPRQIPLANIMAETVLGVQPPMTDRALFLRRDTPRKGNNLVPGVIADF